MELGLIVLGFVLYFFYLALVAELGARGVPQPRNGLTICFYCAVAGLILLFGLYEAGFFVHRPLVI